MSRSSIPSALPQLAGLFALGILLAGCRNSDDPFSYVHVRGTITYDDGTPIATDQIILNFIPQTAQPIGKAHPRVAYASVDTKKGSFDYVTTHRPNDGLVRGKHKVTITDMNRGALPAHVVPPEYADEKKTPLEVDTAQLPFDLKVAKPKAAGGRK